MCAHISTYAHTRRIWCIGNHEQAHKQAHLVTRTYKYVRTYPAHLVYWQPRTSPRTFTPHTPGDQQGNLVLQTGDCCLLILQCLCIKLWGGGLVCVSVCVCARALSHACIHRRMWAHTAHAYTRRHTHSGPCPCWDATQASGLSLAHTPALGLVNVQCTTTGLVFFIE